MRLKLCLPFDDMVTFPCRNQKPLNYEIETWQLYNNTKRGKPRSRNQKPLNYEIETTIVFTCPLFRSE